MGSMPAAQSRHSPRRLAALALATLLAASLAATAGGTALAGRSNTVKPTVVLLHGAFADASGWTGVASRLQDAGYTVVAPPNPLRSLSGDSAYVAGVLAQITGPLVVVGHSYGGAVITNAAAGNPNVKALVYVDAFIPDIGEKVFDLPGAESQLAAHLNFKGFPPFGQTDVEGYISRDAFRAVFCADVSADKAAFMWASQRPAALLTGIEPTTATAWSSIPSFAIIGRQDRTISPAALRSMAQRAGATIKEIDSSHVAMISHPGIVANFIRAAIAATD